MLTFLCFNFRGRVTPPRLEIPVDIVVVVLDVNENGALARIPPELCSNSQIAQ